MNVLKWTQSTITHIILVAGCILFAFPFLWMVTASMKTPREFVMDQIRILPGTPVPRLVSPYIDPREYDDPQRPEAVPAPVWQAARPKLADYWRARLADWPPETPGAPEANVPPHIPDPAVYERAMLNGLFDTYRDRLSDEARAAAVRFQRAQAVAEQDAPSADSLSPAAVEAGVAALLRAAAELTDQRFLSEVFDACYRRPCLGAVRVRTRDYRSHALYTGGEWMVADGPARLVPRRERFGLQQECRTAFDSADDQALLVFDGPLAAADSTNPTPLAPDSIDRIYVSYRGDVSWSRIHFRVIRNGILYHSRPQHFFERDWVEAELRWPEDATNILERRNYLLLEPQGPAPADAPPFQLAVALSPNTPAGAWLAKIARNYRQTFYEVPYLRYIMTSFSLAILNIVLTIFSCTLVGYAFGRLTWPGRDFCFALLLATMMIPPQVTMIPNFLIFKTLGWYNTLLPMWIISLWGVPFFIFLLRQFYKNIPRDLDEAARMDGCGFLRIYWHVMLPLVKPTIAAIAVFTFISSWNNFLTPLIFLNDERLYPLALGLFKFNLQSGADTGLMMAGAFVMTMPIIFLFFFVQRYFIQGISLTGTKG